MLTMTEKKYKQLDLCNCYYINQYPIGQEHVPEVNWP